MANISISELIFILILAFILLGPEELIRVSRTLGLLARKLKQNYQKIQLEINHHLKDLDIASDDGNKISSKFINKDSAPPNTNPKDEIK